MLKFVFLKRNVPMHGGFMRELIDDLAKCAQAKSKRGAPLRNSRVGKTANHFIACVRPATEVGVAGLLPEGKLIPEALPGSHPAPEGQAAGVQVPLILQPRAEQCPKQARHYSLARLQFVVR
jgi:hypothetical protein